MNGRGLGSLEVIWKFPKTRNNYTGFEHRIFHNRRKLNQQYLGLGDRGCAAGPLINTTTYFTEESSFILLTLALNSE